MVALAVTVMVPALGLEGTGEDTHKYPPSKAPPPLCRVEPVATAVQVRLHESVIEAVQPDAVILPAPATISLLPAVGVKLAETTVVPLVTETAGVTEVGLETAT